MGCCSLTLNYWLANSILENNTATIAALVGQWVVADYTTFGPANGRSGDDFTIATLLCQWVVAG